MYKELSKISSEEKCKRADEIVDWRTALLLYSFTISLGLNAYLLSLIFP